MELDGLVTFLTRRLGLGELQLLAPVSGSRTSSHVDLEPFPTQILSNDIHATRVWLSEVEFESGGSV